MLQVKGPYPPLSPSTGISRSPVAHKYAVARYSSFTSLSKASTPPDRLQPACNSN